VIHLVLNDLRCPTGKSLDAGLELLILPLNGDLFVPLAAALASQQRKAALLCLIWIRPLGDLGVEHGHVAAVVLKADDALAHPDHVRSHPDAAVLVGDQGVQQILRDRKVVRRRRFRFCSQNDGVVYHFSDHLYTSMIYFNISIFYALLLLLLSSGLCSIENIRLVIKGECMLICLVIG